MAESDKKELTLYFDGGCPVCSFEVSRYSRCSGSEKLDLRDIDAPDFDPVAEGLADHDWNNYMHARTADGKLLRGMNVFIAVWETLPGWRWLARIASFPLCRPFFNLGYHLFTRIRPWLPRKKKNTGH